MIAEGQVAVDHVGYNTLPWKYAAGTPNILGVIVSAQALRLLVDLVSGRGRLRYFDTAISLPRAPVDTSMALLRRHTQELTDRALRAVQSIDGLTVHGPTDAAERGPLLAFNVAGRSPFELAEAFDREGIESRAGCHCATLAHRALQLDPPASCRLSFYVYNTVDDIDRAVDALPDRGRPQRGLPLVGRGQPDERLENSPHRLQRWYDKVLPPATAVSRP